MALYLFMSSGFLGCSSSCASHKVWSQSLRITTLRVEQFSMREHEMPRFLRLVENAALPAGSMK
jgi:hypothetical protein